MVRMADEHKRKPVIDFEPGRKVELDFENGTELTDAELKKIAGTFIDSVRDIIPTRERAARIMQEIDRMGTFMKTGTGEDDFDCTMSGLPVHAVHMKDGIRIELNGDVSVIDREKLDPYIEFLKERYRDVDKTPVKPFVHHIFMQEMQEGLRPNGIVDLAGLPLSMASMMKISRFIDEML